MNKIVETVKSHGLVPIAISLVIATFYYIYYMKNEEEISNYDKLKIILIATMMHFVLRQIYKPHH